MPPRPVLRRPDGPTVHPVRHPDLDGRAEPDQHPVTAIEGLAEWLADHIAAGANVTVTEADGVLTISASGGSGGGAVDSVNGETGVVVLDAGDVGADPAGTAAGLVDDLSGVTNASAARSNLGLGNVDNTSDANKPVSTAQQTALDGKAAASHSHSGADITSGTVSTARLGTGAANATTFLRGDQTWAAAGGSETLPASIIDAKGDVIVGTAADTAARLAVGADGQVLTADSAQVGGVKWAAAAGGDSVPYVSGNYYSIQGSSTGAAVTAGLNAAGRLGAHPVHLPAGSFQSIGVNIQAGAVSTWRFGIYPNNPATMTPVGQTLIKDMGTISTNITGIASASSTFTISTAGIYWVATLCDSYTASPTVYGFATGMVPPPALPWLGLTAEAVTSSGFISPLIGALSVATGAMPATFPALGGSVFRAINYVPLLLVRAA